MTPFALLEIVLPVFLIIGAGYIASIKNMFSNEHAFGLMRFATQFAIPCLLLVSIAQLDLSAVFKFEVLLPFYIGATVSFILTSLIAWYFFQHKPGVSVSIGFSALFSNSVLIGISIVQLAYGDVALQTAFAIIAVHAPFCYILGITTMEFCRADGLSFISTLKAAFKQIFSNALTIGLFIGFAINLSDISLHSSITKALNLMATASLPAALFSLGAILASYKLSSGLGEVATVSINKLLLHPLIALLLGQYVFHLPDDIIKVIVIIAAMPPGINAYVFANMYSRAENIAASSVMIATAISIFSVSGWLLVLG